MYIDDEVFSLLKMTSVSALIGPKRNSKLHLSGLIGTASHPDMHKIRISGFFFENRLY